MITRRPRRPDRRAVAPVVRVGPATPVVAVIAVLAVLVAVVGPGTPTGVPGVDAVLVAAIAIATTVAGAGARPWAWVAASGLLAVATVDPSGWFAVVAVTFLAAAVLAGARGSPADDPVVGRTIGAVVGAVVATVAWHLPGRGPTGTSAVVGVVAVGLLIGSALGATTRRVRRRVAVGVVVVGVLAAAATVAFAFAALRARPSAVAGSDAARAAVDAARNGDSAAAAAGFATARAELATAARRLDAPWARMAAVVPGVAQNERATRTLVHTARQLVDAGQAALDRANLDALAFTDGRLDPTAVAALEPPLTGVERAVRRARASLRSAGSPWITTPVADRTRQLERYLRTELRDARTARAAARDLPALLGADGPRRYLIMFTTPVEARASGGGFMGNWGILTAADGRLDLTDFGRTGDLGGGRERTVTGEEEYLARYARAGATREWRNVNLSPDFPTVARVAAQMAAQSGLGTIDGVIGVNPSGLAAVLRLTGPVEVPGLDGPLTTDNAEAILLRDQYLTFPDTTARTDFLESASRAVADRFAATDLPGPAEIARVLAPAVRAGDITFVSLDPAHAGLLERVGATGAFPSPDGDVFGLVTQNASASKLELFLHRSVDLQTSFDAATGIQRTVATVHLRNDAPADGLPSYVIGNALGLPPGTSRLLVSVYSPLPSATLTVDGTATPVNRAKELGLHVFSTDVTIPPGGDVTLVLRLDGPVRWQLHGAGAAYRLTLWRQALVAPDDVAVAVTAPTGYAIGDPAHGLRAAGDRATFAAPLRHTRTLAVTIRR